MSMPGVTSVSAASAATATPLVAGDEVLSVLPGTLPVAELARRLAGHRAVQRVRYPGLEPDPVAVDYVDAFGPLLSFDVADADAATRVERALELIENATSLGGVASTLEARARWEPTRVPPGLLRLSVGLEDADDLWADLAQALDHALSA